MTDKIAEWIEKLATGKKATEDAQDNAGDSDEDEDKENRLGLVEVEQLTHPSDHLGEELTNLRKQRSNDRRSSLKSSSFHKIFMGTCHGRSRRTNIEKTAAKTMK
jgi:hypothetical protein